MCYERRLPPSRSVITDEAFHVSVRLSPIAAQRIKMLLLFSPWVVLTLGDPATRQS